MVLVRAGDKMPVDGRIVSGGGSVNEAPITGESVPKDKNEGDEVFAGTVLESGAVDMRTEKVGADTTFARIVSWSKRPRSRRLRCRSWPTGSRPG